MSPDQWQVHAQNLANVVAPAVGDAGMQLWQGLALIVVVWTGIQMAMSGGGLNMAVVARLALGLSIPLGMLRFYVAPLPGTTLSVPDIITGMGRWLQGVIIADAGEDMRAALRTLAQELWGGLTLSSGPEDQGFWDQLAGAVDALLAIVMGGPFVLIVVALMIVVYAVGQAQVIWAQLAITLAVLLGPIFIPFLVVPPLSFLFWGWLRTMLTYSLYAAVAAAMFRVTTQVGLVALQGLGTTEAVGTPLGLGEMLDNVLTGVFFGVAALLGSLKVGEFSQMLLSGMGSTSSGAGTRVRQLARVR